MIKKLEISGIHLKTNPKLREYVTKKIGKLDRYLPRAARESAHAEVMLKEANHKAKKEYICEVVMQLPHETITVAESTINIFAAVDIVEAKLKNLLKKYKEMHGSLRIHRRMLASMRRRTSI